MIVGLHTLGETSAFVNPVGQLRRGKTRMEGVKYSPSLIPLCWIVDAFARIKMAYAVSLHQMDVAFSVYMKMVSDNL